MPLNTQVLHSCENIRLKLGNVKCQVISRSLKLIFTDFNDRRAANIPIIMPFTVIDYNLTASEY